MSRRTRQKQQTRIRLIDAARWCFREHGFEGTTIAKVARQSDVAVGTVISHFPDKASLVAAAFHAEIDEQIEHALTDVPEGDAIGVLLHVAGTLYEWYAEDPILSSHLLQQTLFLSGTVGDENQAQLLAFLQRLGPIVVGRLPPSLHAHTELVVQAFLLDYFGVLIQSLREARVGGGDFNMMKAMKQLDALLRVRLAGFAALGERTDPSIG